MNILKLRFADAYPSLLFTLTVFLVLAGLPINSNLAHSEENNGLEILVKGAPFKDPLGSIPQSASVSLFEDLQRQEVTTFQDTIESIPNFSYSGGTSRPRFFLIRGVGELEQYEGAPNPSVATVVDDIDFSGLGIPMPLFDIERVEVLRGPQGIQYGANGLAGVVAIRSQDPTADINGFVSLQGGNDNLRSGGAAVGGAIPGTDDKLMLRVSAYRTAQDGFRNNVFLNRDDTNKRDEQFARVKLRYAPNEDLTIDLVGWLSDADNGFDAFTIDNSLTNQSDDPGQDSLATRAGALKIGANLSDDLQFESITAAMNAEQDYSFDGDWGNNPFWAPFDPYDFFSDSDRERTMYSQEFRFHGNESEYRHGENYRWLAGTFIQELTEDTLTREFSDDIEFDSLESDYDATTGAVFGQVEIPLATDTAITAGLRLERRDARYTDSRSARLNPDHSVAGGQIALTHDLDDSTRVYAQISRGYKGGGVNAGPSVPTSQRTFEPEFLWNAETGIKGSWFDDFITSSVAVFYQSRRDQQLKFAFQDDPSDPLSFTFITDSSAEGQSVGLELDTVIRPIDGIELYGNGSLLESEFTDVPSQVPDLDGRQFSHAPSWQYAAGVRVAPHENFFGRLEVTGRDRFFFDDSHSQRSNPYHLVNASVAYINNGLRVSLWAKNLFDQNYATRGFFFGNEPPNFPNTLYIQRGDPQAFGITVSQSFG